MHDDGLFVAELLGVLVQLPAADGAVRDEVVGPTHVEDVCDLNPIRVSPKQ